MTETPPPRRALATFLRRPAPGAPQPPPAEVPEAQDAPGEPAAAADPASSDIAPGATPENTAATPETAAPVAADADADAPAASVEPATEPVDEPTAPTPPEPAAPPLDAAPPAAPTPAPSAVAAADWRAAALPVATPHAPTFARPRAKAGVPRAPVWQWAMLCLLALLLVLQILLADRARLASDARWRPLLSTLCGVLRCELPVWHEPAAFTMLDRDVRPAPEQNGQGSVLRIQASFRNDARWSQAWPYLQLSLSDADGRVIGSRAFAPAEYLGHAPAPGETLAPGQSGRIDFRVREPAAGTAAFTFDFH